MSQLSPTELIQRHQNGIWRYLRALGCDASTADDLTQETFLRVLRRDNFVQHSDAATSEYLRRTAYNLLISNHRKFKRVQVSDSVLLLDESWQRWAGKDLTGNEAVDALKNCLETLSERARDALRLKYVDNLPRIQIGEALGISDHGARNLLQRAKAQLRECVGQRLKSEHPV